MTFAERLKWLREMRRITEAELAERAGVTYGALRNWTTGRRVPSYPAVVALARALGVSAGEFQECEFGYQAQKRQSQ